VTGGTHAAAAPRDERAALPTVSIVMAVRNEERWIERGVRAVLDQTYPGDRLEVVVVVGASHDRTREIVERLAAEDSRVVLVDNPEGTTPAALNLGIRRASGELYARVDGHMWIADDFIASGVEVLTRTGVSGVGGKATFVGTSPTSEAVALALGSRAGGGNAAFRIGGAERPADTLAFGIYPLAVFERVGLFDESLLYNQDDEWHHRARLGGESFVFTPRMAFTHVARGSLRALWHQYYFWGVYRIATIAKHRRPGAARQLAPAALVALLGSATLVDVASGGRRRVGRRLWLAYAATLACAGAAVSVRARRPRLAPLVAAALATMHLSYGLGFWRELGARLLRRPGLARSRAGR
jgi:succinoglycan biosynthesis protein ExoA